MSVYVIAASISIYGATDRSNITSDSKWHPLCALASTGEVSTYLLLYYGALFISIPRNRLPAYDLTSPSLSSLS